MNIQRRIYEANKALSYFVTNNWNFQNENFYELCSLLRLEDIREFEFRHAFKTDIIFSIRSYTLGYRRYLMKEKDETLKACQKKYQNLSNLNRLFKALLFMIVFGFIWYKYDAMKLLKASFELKL
jgi:hypothetical protein